MRKEEETDALALAESAEPKAKSVPTGISGLIFSMKEGARMLLQPRKPEREVVLPEPMGQLVLDNQGKRFSAVGNSASIHLLDAQSGGVIQTIDSEKSHPCNVQWSPDSSLLAGEMSYGNSLSNYRIGIWDAKSGKRMNLIHDMDTLGYPNSTFIDYCFLDNQRIALAVGTSRTELGRGIIKIYDVQSGKPIETILPAACDDPFHVSIALIPAIVHARGGDAPRIQKDTAHPFLKKMRFPSHRFGTHSYTDEFHFSHRPSTLSPRQEKLAKFSRMTGVVALEDTSTHTKRREVKIQNHCSSYEKSAQHFSVSDGERLAVGFKDGIRVWDTSFGATDRQNLGSNQYPPDLHCDRFRADKTVYGVKFIDDNTLVTVGEEGKLKNDY